MQTRVIKIDLPKGSAAERLGNLDTSALGKRIAPAVRALRAGKLVAFPTETVYGLGVAATDARAVARLRKLKGRPKSPFTVHLASPAEVKRYVKDIPLPARTLMAKAWPGPVTILLPAGRAFAHPALRNKALLKRIAPTGVVGLRCPDHPVAQLLLKRVAKPVLATSANPRAHRPPTSAEDVLAQIDGRIDVLVDAGPTRYGKASTIVAFDGTACKVLREGVLDAAAIGRMIHRRVLFICTGNTCRSPMAAALARKMLAERLGCDADELKGFGQEVLSAGVFAGAGGPATENAVSAAAELGGNVGKHRSRKLTGELIRAADLIFCMAHSHVAEVVRQVPDAAGKTFLLDGAGDIEDPIGRNLQTYLRVARHIERGLKKRTKENLL